MNSRLVNAREQIIQADRKNILISGIILILIGVVFLILTFPSFGSNFGYFLIVPITYIISGIIGIHSARTENSFSLKIYKITIISLLTLNLIIIAIGFVAEIILFLNPPTCRQHPSDTCGLAEAIYYFAIIFVIIVIIVSGLTVAFLAFFMKNLKRYQEDKSGMNFNAVEL